MDVHSVVALRLIPALGVLLCCYLVYVGDVLDLLVVVATNCNSLYVLEPCQGPVLDSLCPRFSDVSRHHVPLL